MLGKFQIHINGELIGECVNVVITLGNISMKMFQINEDDLKALEAMAVWTTNEQFKKIVSNIRWNYGPRYEKVYCDCDCGTVCPNGKFGMEERCMILKKVND